MNMGALTEDLDTPQRRLIDQEQAAQEAEKALSSYRALPWWRFDEKRYSRQMWQIAGRREKSARAAVRPGDVDRVASALVQGVWRDHAGRVAPDQNPWRPSLTELRQQSSDMLAEKVAAHTLYAAHDFPVRVAELPVVAELITADWCLQELDRVAALIGAAVSSQRFEVAHRGGGVFVIEHPSTGIRASFTLPGNQQPYGQIFSKPYNIAPVAEDCAAGDGFAYWGLGVGTRIYQEGAARWPQVRWATGTTSTYSRPLRGRLHLQDPYRWQFGWCDWCEDRGLLYSRTWVAADRSAFTGHP